MAKTEIKAKEKAEQERKLKELEQENERLKAELAKNRTETALETQNEPKPSQEITQSEKTQENAPKAKSQEQIDLEIAQRLDEKKYWEQTDTTTFYNILKRLEMRKKPQERKLDDLKYLDGELNKPIIYGRHDLTKYAISELNELIAKEIEKEQANQTAQTPSTFDKEPEKSQEVFKEFKELCDYLEKYHFLTTDGKINVAKRAGERLSIDTTKSYEEIQNSQSPKRKEIVEKIREVLSTVDQIYQGQLLEKIGTNKNDKTAINVIDTCAKYSEPLWHIKTIAKGNITSKLISLKVFENDV